MRVPTPMVPRYARWTGVFVVLAVIFYYSIVAIPPDTASPGGIALPTWRHVLAYVALGYSLTYALCDSDLPRTRRFLLVLAIGTGYGICIELGQAFVPERTASVADALVNAVAVGSCIVWYALEPRLEFVRVPEEAT